MADSKSKNAANFKTAVRIKAEEVSRQVIQEAEAQAAARALARAKIRLENENSIASAKEAAMAREAALAAKEAKIAAIGKDEWFYLQDGNQFGPFGLAELRLKIADASIVPPIQSVWTEGMDEWSPVYEVRMLYDTNPVPLTQISADSDAKARLAEVADGLKKEKSARNAAAKAKSEQDARSKAAAVAKASEEMELKAAAEAKAKQEADLRIAAEAKAEEQKKLKQAAEAKAAQEAKLREIAAAKAAEVTQAAKEKAENEARIRAEEELRVQNLAEAKAQEEAKLKAIAEAKAIEETKLRIAAEKKAAEEARLLALAEAKAIEEARLAELAKAKAEQQAKAKAALAEKAAQEAKLAQIAKAKAKAEEEARLKAAAEAKALEETNLRIAAEKEAAEEAKRKTEQIAAEEARLRAAAEAKAVEETKLRIATEKKAAEEARFKALAGKNAIEEARTSEAVLRKAEPIADTDGQTGEQAPLESQNRVESDPKAAANHHKEYDDEEAKAQAEIDALAAEEERIAGIAMAKARAKAENKARATELARIAAAAKSKIRKEARSQSIERARLKALAKKAATEKRARTDEAKSKQVPERQETAVNGIQSITAAEESAKQIKQITKEPDNPEIATKEVSPTLLPAEQHQHDEPSVSSFMQEAAAAPTSASQAAIIKSPTKSKPGRVSSKSVWFYTCEGDRLGPVTFEELKAMAAASTLDPRLDMVWKKGMAAWQTAGKTDGLFDRVTAATEKQEKPATPTASYRPSKKGSMAWTGASTPWPGARRRSMLFAILIFPIAWYLTLEFASPFLIQKFGRLLMGEILPFSAYVPLLFFACFAWKRLTNLGMSHWWMLGAITPIINLWVGFRCLACPSGYACHKRLDSRGRILATAYWLLVIGGISFVAFTTTPLTELTKASDLPGRLKSLIQSTSLQLSRSK